MDSELKTILACLIAMALTLLVVAIFSNRNNTHVYISDGVCIAGHPVICDEHTGE